MECTASINIEYNYVSSDHKPLCIGINVSDLPEYNFTDCPSENYCVNWANINDTERKQYSHYTELLLSNICIPHDAILCKSVTCNNPSHRHAIDLFYNNIVEVLQKASSYFHKKRKQTSDNSKFSHIPGWNEYVKEAHEASRDTFLLWKCSGQPREGHIADLMRKSRANYKYAIRFCKRNEESLRADSLAKKLAINNIEGFWKEVKVVNNSKVPISTSVDGVTGMDSVAEMWRKHYESLFNCLNSSGNSDTMHTSVFDGNMRVNCDEVYDCIRTCANGKSPGIDKIMNEHLKFASHRLTYLLGMCFSAMFLHGFIPENMIKTVIVPIIKDKSGKVSDKSNYRPVALSTAISKVFEQIMLNRLVPYLNTTCNQFGFKKKHSTDMCIFLLKEVIRYYHNNSSPMFVCFMDASKAFDRIEHNILFHKLLERNVPVYLVKILCFWYSNQLMCVRWGTSMSSFFNVSNGVRQGGILSPLLFNVYMDKLSASLLSKRIGCIVGTLIINHLIYADDLVLMAPSAKSLQVLINTCFQYGQKNSINFNEKKTVLMLINSSWSKNVAFPNIYLGMKMLNNVDKYKYLGHWISSDLTDNLDINRQVQNIYSRGNMLIRKFYVCSESVKIMLFRTYLSSMYNCQLWCKYNRSIMYKLSVAYNNVFRILLHLPRIASITKMLAERNVLHSQAIIRKAIFSLYDRVGNSSNNILCSVMNSDFVFKSDLLKVWRKILYLSSIH